MKEIPLRGGGVALIDDADLAAVASYSWRRHRNGTKVYAIATGQGAGWGTLLHRLILNVTDPSILVDHRDGNGLNNVRSNIRMAGRAQNAWNAGAHNDGKSPFVGVWQRPSGRWAAQIMANGLRYTIGTFDSQEEAAEAYDEKAIEIHGEFARLNFPKKENEQF